MPADENPPDVTLASTPTRTDGLLSPADDLKGSDRLSPPAGNESSDLKSPLMEEGSSDRESPLTDDEGSDRKSPPTEGSGDLSPPATAESDGSGHLPSGASSSASECAFSSGTGTGGETSPVKTPGLGADLRPALEDLTNGIAARLAVTPAVEQGLAAALTNLEMEVTEETPDPTKGAKDTPTPPGAGSDPPENDGFWTDVGPDGKPLVTFKQAVTGPDHVSKPDPLPRGATGRQIETHARALQKYETWRLQQQAEAEAAERQRKTEAKRVRDDKARKEKEDQRARSAAEDEEGRRSQQHRTNSGAYSNRPGSSARKHSTLGDHARANPGLREDNRRPQRERRGERPDRRSPTRQQAQVERALSGAENGGAGGKTTMDTLREDIGRREWQERFNRRSKYLESLAAECTPVKEMDPRTAMYGLEVSPHCGREIWYDQGDDESLTLRPENIAKRFIERSAGWLSRMKSGREGSTMAIAPQEMDDVTTFDLFRPLSLTDGTRRPLRLSCLGPRQGGGIYSLSQVLATCLSTILPLSNKGRLTLAEALRRRSGTPAEHVAAVRLAVQQSREAYGKELDYVQYAFVSGGIVMFLTSAYLVAKLSRHGNEGCSRLREHLLKKVSDNGRQCTSVIYEVPECDLKEFQPWYDYIEEHLNPEATEDLKYGCLTGEWYSVCITDAILELSAIFRRPVRAPEGPRGPANRGPQGGPPGRGSRGAKRGPMGRGGGGPPHKGAKWGSGSNGPQERAYGRR